LVGTSLSLFDPIARCVRPISIPKLRTNFWITILYYLRKYLVSKLSSHEKIAIEQKKFNLFLARLLPPLIIVLNE
jgi:hypothetical protein